MPLNHNSTYSDLTDYQYTLIGKIVLEFSNLEFLCGALLNKMLLTHEFLGRTYTDSMSISTIQESIKNALELHKLRFNFRIINEEKLEEIKTLNDKITQIRAVRNTFAHYKWMRNTDDQIIGFKLSGRIPNMKNPNRDSKSFTNTDLVALYKEIYLIVNKLNEIVDELPEYEINEEFVKRLTFKN